MINNLTPEELVSRVMRSFDVDMGRMHALHMGVDYEEVKKMSDDDLVAFGKEVSSWPRKEPEFCESCGQDL